MNLPALKSAADWCAKHSIIIPDDIVAGLYQHGVDVKTPGYYARVMWEAVRELYAGDIEAYDFEEVMLRLISEQLRKAWSEGMRELNLDPQTDQTEEGEAYLQEIMASELDYVGQLAEDILAASVAGQSVKGGEGSGNFGHEGRPGEVGGSASDGGGTARDEAARQLYSGYENDENTSTVYRDGKLVGFYNGHVAKNPPEKIKKLVGSKPFVLSAIATFEKGYGRELVSAAINTARSSGASGVVFYSDNENSSGFYSHLGISRSDDDKEIFYITKKEFGNY